MNSIGVMEAFKVYLEHKNNFFFLKKNVQMLKVRPLILRSVGTLHNLIKDKRMFLKKEKKKERYVM